MGKYKRPGIYIEEHDVSGIWCIPKNRIRKDKIKKIFDLDIDTTINILSISPKGMISQPIIINNYDDFETNFGKKNI